ncbi:DUF1345 domain-containing protein [Kribbella sp. CA-293567]|uniref:DUF1345 domain-containing protein n=1 Tax=Kribbella sp. CA-293567 TaxID=3002436 RepID=UPI0022DCF4B3|nr:DUF1345 domain-containing protein [Kribbella sp. CA-293567]WBQ07519.1 DUF1345 domain-containing protein [Kribbella sp. CA-293567]
MPWWTRESVRQTLAIPLAVLIAVLMPGDTMVRTIAAWDAYTVCYLLLTWLAYRNRDPVALRAMALPSRRRKLTDRLFVSSPEQLSQAAAVLALVTTVLTLPQARDLGAPPTLVVWLCVISVISCWLTLQTGFAISYLSLYVEEGGLDFPGDQEPGVVDFAYFAVSVGTTFGTTDVTVTRSRMRRQVLVHGVLAFLFNTLILAVAITIVSTYLSGS